MIFRRLPKCKFSVKIRFNYELEITNYELVAEYLKWSFLII